MGYLDEAITELDGMESTLSSYKIHLNVWMVFTQQMTTDTCNRLLELILLIFNLKTEVFRYRHRIKRCC